MSTLAAADWAEFAFLKEKLALSDSALSKQLATLEEAGYVSTERRLTGTRYKLFTQLTATGRKAFDGHIAALRAIVGQAQAATDR